MDCSCDEKVGCHVVTAHVRDVYEGKNTSMFLDKDLNAFLGFLEREGGQLD